MVKSMIKTREQLIVENEELHSLLQELKETIRAIQNGEVDAIVVSGAKGEQVYSVSTAETPYRTFIEEMSEGAITLTKDGIILYCNQKFTEFVESPFEKVVGSELKRFISPKDNSKIDRFLNHLPQRGQDVVIVSLTNTLYLRLSIHRLPPYLQGENYLLIATDISDLKKRENEQFELIGKLVRHIRILQELRIDNINQTLDAEGIKNKMEKANNKLEKEIIRLNQLVEELKLKIKQKKESDQFLL
jgi:PAS domain S-box-containing protein